MCDAKGFEKAVTYPAQLLCYEKQTNTIKELNEEIIYLNEEIKIYKELIEEAGTGNQNIIDKNIM